MNYKNMLRFALSAICLISISSFAAVVEKKSAPKLIMVSADKAIHNLDKALADVKENSNIALVFPTQVPAPKNKQTYFASKDDASNDRYVINVDLTDKCNGAKYCSVGNVVAVANHDPDVKAITVKVKLDKNIEGYYTPSHAEADFWPATISWSNAGALYTISWKLDGKNEKQFLVNLANSAIDKGSR